MLVCENQDSTLQRLSSFVLEISEKVQKSL